MRKNRLYITSSDQIITCEYCGVTVPASQAYSFICVYAMPGKAQGGTDTQQYEPFQCSGEQHFADTHEHAMLLLMICALHVESLHPLAKQLKKTSRDNPELGQIESVLRGKKPDLDLS